jgi:SAM-dependent methyltransferase
MGASGDLRNLLACPRCDKTPLSDDGGHWHCGACKIDFPSVNGIPWLFAEPQATLGEWRGRLQFALQKIGHDAAGLDHELNDDNLRPLTVRRLERHKKALDDHRRNLQKILQPLDVQSMTGNYESYLALRTRLPSDQGLTTYYANVHRDWSWGDAENAAAMEQVRAVLHENAELGNVLVLGAGSGRLAYDLHMQMSCDQTVALDFNPMLLLVAQAVTRGNELSLHEFPIAPKSLEDDVILRTLAAPEPVRDGFQLVLGDALRPPLAAKTFDTIVTPWLIDIITEDLSTLASRLNGLLKPDGRWVNFGSLAFSGPNRASQYSPEECKAIVAECGFSAPRVSETTIPYMCSPASRHGRQEKVFTFSAGKERDVAPPARYRALPDWIVTGKDPVPLTPEFRTQAMTTQIYSFIMSLIDGKRTLKDMALVLEKQQLMSRDEAEPAIRSFLTKMYDDAQRHSGF